MRPTEYIAPLLAVLLALAVGWMAVSRAARSVRPAEPQPRRLPMLR